MQKVIVWEWQENDGSWIPYRPENSNEIEKAQRSGNQAISILIYVEFLKHSLLYNVDLAALHQENPVTNKTRQIRRGSLDLNSALGQDVTWEWKKELRLDLWASYSTKLIEEIELAYQRKSKKFRFPPHYRMPYTIDFKSMCQINDKTNFKRKIRRVQLLHSYVTNSNTSTVPSSGGYFPQSNTNSSYPHQGHSYDPTAGSYPHQAPSHNPYNGNHSNFGSGIVGGYPPMSQSNITSSHTNYLTPSMAPPMNYPSGQMYQPSSNTNNPTHPYSTYSASAASPHYSQSHHNSAHGVSAAPIHPALSSTNSASNYLTSWNGAAASQGHRTAANSSVPMNSTTVTSTAVSTTTSISQSQTSSTSTANQPVQSSGQPQAQGASSTKTNKWTQRPVAWKPCPPSGIPCSPRSSQNTSASQALASHTTKTQVPSTCTDKCSICQFDITDESGFGNNKDTVELNLCKHVFHEECVEASYTNGVQDGCIICPYCNRKHGIKTGTQPNGTMRYSLMSTQLQGYSGCGTIKIEYHISPGTQGPEHPNPGTSFRAPAFPRIGYLPDNDEGRSILYLLVEAWKRRLIFTVGKSSTSGQDNVVTWTGIHHKTSTNAAGGHGYPDPTYLQRVRDELKAEGVEEDPSQG